MTLRSLEIFAAVARTKSMSEAARELMISQPSVSSTIAEIEQEYSVTLFDRVHRTLRLTGAGTTLYKYAADILAMHGEMESFLRNETHAPFVRIGATATVGACVIPQIVCAMTAENPALRHSVSVANTRLIENMLLGGELDIALVEGEIEHPDMIVKKAIDDRLVAICSTDHPFAKKETVTLADIAGQKLIVREKGSGTRAQLLKALADAGLHADILWDAYNFETIINAVEQNIGISVLSKRLVERQIARNELHCCEIEGADFSRTFRLVWHRNKLMTNTMELFCRACMSFGEAERTEERKD